MSQGVGVCTVCTFANRPFVSGFLTENLLVLCSNKDVLKETMAEDEQGLRTGEKWTLFGNEAEKVEVLREQRYVRQRCDHMALRRQVRVCCDLITYRYPRTLWTLNYRPTVL